MKVETRRQTWGLCPASENANAHIENPFAGLCRPSNRVLRNSKTKWRRRESANHRKRETRTRPRGQARSWRENWDAIDRAERSGKKKKRLT